MDNNDNDNDNDNVHQSDPINSLFNTIGEYRSYSGSNSTSGTNPSHWGAGAYTFDSYQDDTGITAIYPGAGQATPIAFAYLCLKLNGEAGEVGEAYAKFLRGDYDIEEAKRRISKELGDVLWYISQLASELDLSLGNVAANNIRKLADRQRRGVLRGSGDER